MRPAGLAFTSCARPAQASTPASSGGAYGLGACNASSNSGPWSAQWALFALGFLCSCLSVVNNAPGATLPQLMFWECSGDCCRLMGLLLMLLGVCRTAESAGTAAVEHVDMLRTRLVGRTGAYEWILPDIYFINI
ncbi:hypothetical protein PC116_g21161 [Phytophthora cactorum]|nr:hypothetical protein PC116_g21161 [Phytophthora cactorum]